MNLNKLHTSPNPVSLAEVNSKLQSKVKAIRILENQQLKEHTTPVPALLICINGEAIFEDENGEHIMLNNGDFVNIEPNLKHWVTAKQESNFVLIK